MKTNIPKDHLASLLLRVGLASVFLFAAVSSLMHPVEWVGYLPTFLAKMHDAASLLKLFALIEIVLAVWLLSGKYLKYAAVLTSLMLVGIVLAQPSDFVVTFRDIGLVFMALALGVLSL
jgi:uncharacterized membrane protein YphA (DoxX/SURF4 family)